MDGANDRPSTESDLLDPAVEDWASYGDNKVYHAAAAGVPEAIAELARRDRADRPPMGNCVVIPSEEDWTRHTDSTVHDASNAGIPEAIRERQRRDRRDERAGR